MNKPIGGYFSLELPLETTNALNHYGINSLALNTGRNCLEYILRCKGYRKVYIPYYTCSVVLEPFMKLGVAYEYYHIDKQLEVATNVELKTDEALLYTNYFGLKQVYIETLAKRYGSQLIVDNTQAFYSRPIEGIDSFNTCRKYFGVPDGAYLYTDKLADFDLEQDVSYDRMSFLLKRLDLGAEAGYADFREQSERLIGQPIKRMSNLTEKLMSGIDYQAIAQKRRDNYQYIHGHLASLNQFQLPLPDNAVPMVYPFLTDDTTLKQRLIAAKVFVATYWPNVFDWCMKDDWEYQIAERTIFIPIDQRYGIPELEQIIHIINS